MAARIVVPLDGSQLAERSLGWLRFFKGAKHLSIDLVRVKETPDDPATDKEMNAYLADRALDLKAQLGTEVQTRVTAGMPFLAILEEAETEDVSMIVMATHGRSGRKKRGVGSVTDKIARYSPCPTLVISPSCANKKDEIDLLVVPLDGSRLAEEALPVASTLAEKLEKPVLLLRVVGDAGARDPHGQRRDQFHDESDAEQYLATVRRTLPDSLIVQGVVRRGPVIETLIAELRKHPGALLVMSSHGGEGYRSYAIGRISDEVLLGTPVPVLLVGPGQSKRIAQAFAD